MEVEGVPPGLEMFARATRVLPSLAQLERLLILDDVWTDRLERAQGEGESEPVDFRDLIALADEIERALEAAPAATAQVLQLLKEQQDVESDRVLQVIAAGDEQAAGALDELLREDLGDLEPRAAFTAACLYVEAETGAEIDHLRGKRAQLQAEELPDPDLRPAFRCLGTLAGIGALWGLAAAGAVTVVGIPIAIGAGVVGSGTTLVEKWKKGGCKETARAALEKFA